MSILILGLFLFIGVHSVRIVADDWRQQTIARMGPNPYKGIYSLISAVGLGLMVWGFGVARMEPQVLWVTPAWAPKVAGVLLLVSMISLAGSYVPRSHIRVTVRHPMLWGTALLAAAHLLANNTVAEVVLFTALLAWSLANVVSCYRRDRQNGTRFPSPAWSMTALNVVLGAGLWLAIVQYLHQVAFGMPTGLGF